MTSSPSPPLLHKSILWAALSLSMLYATLCLAQDTHKFGEPWVFPIDKDTTHQYNLMGVASETDQWLDIIATPLVGECDLYVSNTVHQPNYENCVAQPGECRNSTSAHGDLVSLYHDDPIFGEHHIHVGVQCLSNAIYMMNAYISESENVNFIMQDGLPQVATVHIPGHYATFTFNMDDIPEDQRGSFSVSVSPIGNSDPDIYIKHGSAATSSDYTWKSTGFKGDVIHIDSTQDPDFKDTGIYHIGVKGFTTGQFVISVLLDGSYSRLMESIPLIHSVKKDESRYFTFETRDAQRLIISTSPMSSGGNPDLYVTDEEGVQDDKKPGPDNYKWKSSNVHGIDSVTIDDAPVGKYYIAIVGKEESSFSVVAYPEQFNNMLLLDGVTQQLTLGAADQQFFKYYHGDADSGIEIQVVNQDTTGQTTAFSLYTSRTYTHPDGSPGKYEVEGTKVGLTTILKIDKDDSKVGTYFIGLLNPSIHYAAPYSIVASSTQSVQTLLNGRASRWNSVPRDYYRYYMIELPNRGESDIIISTSVSSGDVDLYVSTKTQKPSKSYCQDHPDECWKGEKYGQDSITITHGDTKITSNTFYIAVLGYRAENEFDILAYTTGTPMQLSEGEQVTGSVQKSMYDYYIIPVTASGSLRIDLQLTDPSSTDADLYFSRTIEKPNTVSCKEEGACIKGLKFGSDYIETDVTPQTYYLGVKGITSATGVVGYTLSASQSSFRLTLNAQSMLQHGDKGQIKRYQFHVQGAHNYVVMSTTLISGRTTMYLSSDSTQEVGPDNYMWKSDLWPGNVLLISNTEEGYSQGTWAAAVVSEESSDYYVSASGGNENWHNTQLSLGKPLLFAAPKNDYMYLRFRVCPSCEYGVQSPVDYYLNVDVISGSVQVYVKQGFERPDEDSFTFKSEGGQSRSMLLSKDKLKSGITYVAVKGITSDTKVRITATSKDTAIFVTNDQPQRLNFESDTESKYFQVLNTKEEEKLQISVESCTTASPPVVYGSKTEEHPTKDTHDYESTAKGPYRQLIEINSPAASDSPVTFVGLQGTGKRDELSFVTYRTSAIPIIDNDAITGTLADSKLTISVPEATSNPMFDSSDFSYEVYISDLAVSPGQDPEPQNFETVCAIEKANRDGEIHTNSQRASASNSVDYEMKEVDLSKSYMLNVVVRDERGLKTKYAPRFINIGHVMDKYVPACFGRLSSDDQVCSGKGTCEKADTCTCSDPSKWGGQKCEQPVCFGLTADRKDVCSGHGTCASPGQCKCEEGYTGKDCSATPGGVSPAAVLVPLFLIFFCCCAGVLITLGIAGAILGYRRYRQKAYATFEDDDDMAYLDNRDQFEEL